MTSFSIITIFLKMFFFLSLVITITALPFIEQTNIPITIPTGEVLLDNQIEVLNSSLSVYYLTKTSDNTTIKINQYTIVGTTHTQQSCTLVDSLKFNGPIFNVLLNSVSLFYTNQNSGIYRLIINKDTLTMTSNTTQYATFGGIYSRRWDYYFFANQYYSTGMYNHIEDPNPAYLFVANTYYGYPIEFFLSKNEDLLITLLQNHNMIELRHLINATQAINYFGNPTLISTSPGGYQCFCQSNDGTVLYMLDNNGDLLAIDVATNTVSSTMLGIYGPNKCYQEKETGYLVFMI